MLRFFWSNCCFDIDSFEELIKSMDYYNFLSIFMISILVPNIYSYVVGQSPHYITKMAANSPAFEASSNYCAESNPEKYEENYNFDTIGPMSKNKLSRDNPDWWLFLETISNRQARCLLPSLRLNVTETAVALESKRLDFEGARALLYSLRGYEQLRAVITLLKYRSPIWSTRLLNTLMLQVADDLSQKPLPSSYASHVLPRHLFSRPDQDLLLVKNFMQGFDVGLALRLENVPRTDQDRFFVQMNEAGLGWNRYSPEIQSTVWDIFSSMMTVHPNEPFRWSEAALDVGAQLFHPTSVSPQSFQRFSAAQLNHLMLTNKFGHVSEAGLVRIVSTLMEDKGEVEKNSDFFRKLGGNIGYMRRDLLPRYFDRYLMTSTVYLETLDVKNRKHASLFDIILKRLDTAAEDNRDKQLHLSCYATLVEMESKFDLLFIQHNMQRFPECMLPAPAQTLVKKYLKSRPNILRSLTMEDLIKLRGFFEALETSVVVQLEDSTVSQFLQRFKSEQLTTTDVQAQILMQKLIKSNQAVLDVNNNILQYLPYTYMATRRSETFGNVKSNMPRWTKLYLLEKEDKYVTEPLDGVEIRHIGNGASVLGLEELKRVRKEDIISVIYSMQQTLTGEESMQYARISSQILGDIMNPFRNSESSLEELSDFEISAIPTIVLRDFPVIFLPRQNIKRCEEVVRRIGSTSDLFTTVPAFKRRQIVNHYFLYCREGWQTYAELDYRDFSTLGPLSCDINPTFIRKTAKPVLLRNLFQIRNCCISPKFADALREVIGKQTELWDPFWLSDLGNAACDVLRPDDSLPKSISDPVISQILFEQPACHAATEWINGFKIEDETKSTAEIQRIQRSQCRQRLIGVLEKSGGLKGMCSSATQQRGRLNCAQIMSIGKGVLSAELQLLSMDNCTLNRCLGYLGSVDRLPTHIAARILDRAFKLRGVTNSGHLTAQLLTELGNLLVGLEPQQLRGLKLSDGKGMEENFRVVDKISTLSKIDWKIEQRESVFEAVVMALSKIDMDWHQKPLNWAAMGNIACVTRGSRYILRMEAAAFVESLNGFSKLSHQDCVDSGTLSVIWEKAINSQTYFGTFYQQQWQPHLFSFLGNAVAGIKADETHYLTKESVFEIRPEAFKFLHIESLKSILSLFSESLTVPQLNAIMSRRNEDLNDPPTLLLLLKLLAHDNELSVIQDTVTIIAPAPPINEKIPHITPDSSEDSTYRTTLIPHSTHISYLEKYIFIYSNSKTTLPNGALILLTVTLLVQLKLHNACIS